MYDSSNQLVTGVLRNELFTEANTQDGLLQLGAEAIGMGQHRLLYDGIGDRKNVLPSGKRELSAHATSCQFIAALGPDFDAQNGLVEPARENSDAVRLRGPGLDH